MMRHGLNSFSRLSSSALISQNRFPSSLKCLSKHLRWLSTATPKASQSLVVQPTNERYDLFFSEGPSPPMFTPNKGGSGCSEDISDREWQIRTGQFGMLPLGDTLMLQPELPKIIILFDRLLLCRPRHLYPTANASRFLRCWPCLKHRPHKNTSSH
jgi:hypothetical protein